jgi:hypothetical protein
VLRRAVGQGKLGQSSEAPLGAAVREQRRGESEIERALLKALLHAPEHLDRARALLTPEDFTDPDCAALAAWLWSGRIELPESGPEGALARELATGGSPDFEWAPEVEGAARRMVERRLKWQLKACREQLGRVAEADVAAQLMRDIDTIARSLHELSTQPVGGQAGASGTEGGPWR